MIFSRKIQFISK